MEGHLLDLGLHSHGLPQVTRNVLDFEVTGPSQFPLRKISREHLKV